MITEFKATRAAGQERLKAFLPQAAAAYKKARQFDLGSEPGERLSGLSPYLSHRLLTPSEVASAILEQHKPQAAESFLNELFWGTYWRGWLEGRPAVYSQWKRLLAEDSRRWPERTEYQNAVSGQTGIDCFDAWVRELKGTGFLHHLARLNFASIWIFTLKLPWSLGAAFFLEHLLDGSLASNILSWRWVAGLQTKGKHYVADAAKIRTFSEGRFHPEGKLAKSPTALGSSANPVHSPGINFPFQVSEQVGENHALLITGDDLLPEAGGLSSLKPRLVLALSPQVSETQLSDRVLRFKTEAMADAKARATEHFGCECVDFSPSGDVLSEFAEIMKAHQLSALAFHQPFVGAKQAFASQLSSRDVGIKFFPIRRTWDGVFHTHTIKGFVHFKKQALPLIIRKRGRL